MRITFIVPGAGRSPVGGYKVIYEYANGLTARGHEVNLVHPARLPADHNLLDTGKRMLRFVQRGLDRSFRPDDWFKLHPKVEVHWVRSLEPCHIPDADIVVATAWQTAEWVSTYPRTKGAKLYLIQHLETWSGNADQVLNTWKLPMRKVVIARWLRQIAEEQGEEAVYIPNGLDFSAFGTDIAPERRDASSVLMMFHDFAWKGSEDGLRALEAVRSKMPQLRVSLFGVMPFRRPNPTWLTYHRNPTQAKLRSLYNDAAVFVSPSWAEGWPLPPAEAMMCGCALAATDIGGHREYAKHDQTALLSPSRNPAALAESIARLVSDPVLRLRIAHAGHAHIQQFTWERAIDALEQTLVWLQ